MEIRRSQLPGLLNKLRWAIPALMAALGLGYALFDFLLIAPISDAFIYLLSKAIIIGIIGPTLAWLLLSWAARIAQSRQRAEKALERRARQLEIASQVGRKVTAILDADALLAEVVRLIQKQFGYYQVNLFLADQNTNEIVLQECSGHADEALKASGLHLRIGEESMTGAAVLLAQPMLSNNVALEPRYYLHELLPETRSEIAIPLRVGDAVVGVLDIQSAHLDAFQDDDVMTLQIIGDQVAIAIRNANLFRETRRQFEVMRGLHQISLELTAQLDSDTVLATILEQAVAILDVQDSSLAIYNDQTGLIDIIAVHNASPEFQGIALRVGEGAVGKALESQKPLIVNDYKNWPGRSPAFQNSRYDAIVSVPLRWEGNVFGTLSVVDQGERRSFTEDDVQLLSLFADLASIALKNAELYEQVVQLSQHLEQQVEQRTDQLVKAQKALAHKAQQLRRLLAVTVHIQEEERARIAQDLHDGSNQLITGTLYEIQAAQEGLRNRRLETALTQLESAKKLLREIVAENRRIIFGLRPPILDSQGLVPALKWYVETFQQHSPISCSVQVFGQPARLSPHSEIAVYRIVQEALNNVAAHAQAETVCIRAKFEDEWLHLAIKDDGLGFDPENVGATESGQMGLVGMRERAQSIGGRIEVESVPAQGSKVMLSVPFVAGSTSEATLEAVLEETSK